MAPPVEIIQLQPDDDVISVRDRLSFAESHRILLVWPPDGEQVLQRKLDLVLLHRAVRRRAARLALITRDQEVIHNAADLNISTFTSIEESRRERWKRGVSKVFVDRSDRPPGEADTDELRHSATRLRMAPTATQIGLQRARRLILLSVLLAIVLAVMVLFIPSATLTITPVREHIDVTVRIVADPTVQTVDLERSIIPATILQIEIEETAGIETTGSEDVAPTMASGTVIFTNQSDQPVTIPAGTTVNTSAGAIVRFRTLDAVNISGGSNAIAVVAIEALPQFAGPAGNVPAYTINYIDGPLNEILTVENTDPTSGGMVPSNRIVAESDHDRLMASVRGAIQQQALEELSAMIGEHQTIVPESIHIAETRPEWTAFTAGIGEEAASVSLSMRAIVQAVVLDDRMVNQAAFAGLAQRIPDGQIVDTTSISFTRSTVETIDEAGRTVFLANVSGDVTSAVDHETIKQAVAGMSIDAAHRYVSEMVSFAPDQVPQVTVWPSVYNRMPMLPSRIAVTIQEAP